MDYSAPRTDVKPPPQQQPLQAVIIPVTPFQQNCSVIWCTATKRAAIVDPGGGTETILAAVRQHKVTVERILVTHGHVDHSGAVADLRDRLEGVPVDGPHIADRFLLDMLPKQGAGWGMPYARAFTPDRWLDDGDSVCVGEVRFDVVWCPGHTPGHVIFHHAPSEFALVGDVIFKGSIGRTDLPGGDHATLLHSIKHKLFPLGDGVTFLPGHGEISTLGAERMSNPYVGQAASGAGVTGLRRG
jgi:hydroxyacylglutathione hydrolase